jgi:hypothetical protein
MGQGLTTGRYPAAEDNPPMGGNPWGGGRGLAPGYGPAPGYDPSRGHPRSQGYPPNQGYQPNQDYSPGRGYPPAQAATITDETWDQAAAIRRAAAQDAATIRQQANHQAAAIRRAAEQDAAELRRLLVAMSGELDQISAHFSGSPGSPGALATMPAPALAPATAPPRPRMTPAEKPQKQSRQYQAMRITTYVTAALILFAVITGVAEIGLHGFKFFVFRSGGTGETAGNETDRQFLAQQKALAHHVVAPKGRHVIKSH